MQCPAFTLAQIVALVIRDQFENSPFGKGGWFFEKETIRRCPATRKPVNPNAVSRFGMQEAGAAIMTLYAGWGNEANARLGSAPAASDQVTGRLQYVMRVVLAPTFPLS